MLIFWPNLIFDLPHAEYMNGQRAVWMHPSGYLIQQFEGNWHFEQFNSHSQPVKVNAAFMVYCMIILCERESQREREAEGEREGGREKETGKKEGERETQREKEGERGREGEVHERKKEV